MMSCEVDNFNYQSIKLTGNSPGIPEEGTDQALERKLRQGLGARGAIGVPPWILRQPRHDLWNFGAPDVAKKPP